MSAYGGCLKNLKDLKASTAGSRGGNITLYACDVSTDGRPSLPSDIKCTCVACHARDNTRVSCAKTERKSTYVTCQETFNTAATFENHQVPEQDLFL